MKQKENLESYVIDNYLSKLIKINENNKKYIEQKDLDKLHLNQGEKCYIRQLMNKLNISLEDKITKEDRSPYVRDFCYGEIKEIENRKNDEPVKSKLKYDSCDVLTSYDFSKLDIFLEKKFIPNNIIQKLNKSTKVLTSYIPLHMIVKLKLSEEEFEHTMNFLNQHGIKVHGISSTLDGEFENYTYKRTYKSNPLPTVISSDEALSMIKEYQKTKNPKLKENVILGNMRLVPYITYPFSLYYKIDKEELESNGYIGLLEAFESFDPKFGIKFSSHAANRIRYKVLERIEESYGFLHNSLFWKIMKCKSVIEEVEEETLEENLFLIDNILDFMVESGEMLPKVKKDYRTKILSIMPLPLDDYIEDSNYSDDFSLYQSLDKTLLEDAKELLENSLSTLKEREKKIIRLYFGLDDGKSKTLEEIGQILGISKERTRQIKEKALRRLRQPLRLDRLKYFKEEDFSEYNEIPKTKIYKADN